ncbi:MAG: phage tail protein [Tissierellia bacterium]|nr:phage tail protein [Tissierellia bacterium]
MWKNKVKFGLKNVHVWPIISAELDTVTYGDVIPLKGAVELSLKAEGENNPFYADDGVYYDEFSNGGYQGELEIALIPVEYETEVLGYIKDTNGAIVESKDGKGKNYAIAFQFDGDVNQTRHILYNCVSSRPDIVGQTKGEKTEPTTDKLTIKAMPSTDTGYVKAKLEKEMTGYDTFFTTPYKVTEGDL